MQFCQIVPLLMAAALESRAPLGLQLDQCPDLDRATVSRVVTTELQAALTDETQGGPITTATAECVDDQVRLTIDDPVTEKSTTRTVDLAGQPRGLRSRLLGLAISEAVLASWIELQLRSEPSTSQPDAVASPEIRREAASIAERRLQTTSRARTAGSWEIVAGPGVRWFSSGVFTFGLAGGARHWFDNHPDAGIGLELDGSYGAHSVREAQSKLELARTTANGVSFAPSLLMRHAFGRVLVSTGAGWRIALARLSSELKGLRLGSAGWRAWTGPFLEADLSLPISRALYLRATVDIGYVLVPAHGRLGRSSDSEVLIELDGAWLGGLLSLATKF